MRERIDSQPDSQSGRGWEAPAGSHATETGERALPGWLQGVTLVLATVFTFCVFAWGTAQVMGPRADDTPAATAPQSGDPDPAVAPSGHAAVDLPVPAAAERLRITLMRFGQPAEARSGETLRDVPAGTLTGLPLEPAIYVARCSYRGQRLPESTLRVTAGETARIVLPRERLAEIEYQAGVRAARRGEADVPYFERVLRLDPNHVNARLQLAAYSLLHGSTREAEAHLAAVREVAPRNPNLARIERLLREQSGRHS